jgi:hypothetical protein
MVGYLHLVVGGWGSTPIVSGATTTTGGWFLRYSCVSLTGLAVSTNPRGLLGSPSTVWVERGADRRRGEDTTWCIWVMGRTQIYLGDEELALLDGVARATGASR